ncbi:DUF4396 domain-containing protein [Terriglobus aquaticus]|uniref:DUF4396 domain-containing protein n=1 Tax=Terriglobus aquaticus TaxID=940139 RepID=A0ABW9KIN2_9BACT|nr:DUF4396 domain-containing protein [Terriglobus aquaticus]
MLNTFAIVSIVIAVICAITIAADEFRRPQKMGVMNVVWPVTALYFSVFAAWAYFRFGRAKPKSEPMPMQMGSRQGDGMSEAKQPPDPNWTQVATGTSHCGAGCMLADLVSEFGIAAAGITLFGSMLWAEYAIDFAAAWALGIVFQYFALRPMRHDLSAGGVILAAIKADTLSILCFQVGMYAWMALTYFVFFPAPHITPFQPGYWLMMQIAMIFGFLTSYPMNRWLIRHGLKEAM